MKKVLAILLSLSMVLSLAACDGSEEGNPQGSNSNTGDNSGDKTDDNSGDKTEDNSGDNSGDDATDTTEEEKPPVEAEDISYTPLIHLDFENAEGFKGVYENTFDSDYKVTGMEKSDYEIKIAEGQGAVGNALYLDGNYGLEFEMVPVADDSYTISFWYYAERLSNFGPIFQIGRDIPSANPDTPTTWVNFCQTGFDGVTCPVVWNRNTSIPWLNDENGVFPWVGPGQDVIHGKDEWCMVTIVADGVRYNCDVDNGERIGLKYYINGELVWEANAENLFYQGIAPELFSTADELQGFIGINFWDASFKGFIDEFYLYDEPLTDGQVKTLYNMGNPPADPAAP